jgi:hypothetical protein
MKSTGLTEAFVYEAVESGLLEILPDGTIWRVNRRGKSQIAAKLPPGTKYLSVKVMRDGHQVTTTVQRLVYHHFKGPIPPGLTVNHIDGKTTNNHPDNLELATCKEQVRHAIEVLGRLPKDQDGTKNDMAKLTENAVREIRRRRSAGEKLKLIAVDFGISDRTVSKIALGQRWAFLG